MAHKFRKSKLLPRLLPLLYILLIFLKSRGGGKPVTGNVCTPAFGGGDGILRRARSLSPLVDAKGSRRLGGGKCETVLGDTLEESVSGEYVRAAESAAIVAEGGLRPGGGGAARTGDGAPTYEDLGGGGGALSGVATFGLVREVTGFRMGTAAIERDKGEAGLTGDRVRE